ncbi:hypothetical protein IKF04_01895 [Candidatus Saccharibacteria bacterium]|nr:hypothetical protein [Candidatus Saccharibacteria bacterium]
MQNNKVNLTSHNSIDSTPLGLESSEAENISIGSSAQPGDDLAVSAVKAFAASESSPETEKASEPDKITEILSRVPVEERGNLPSLFAAVPENIQEKYTKTIEGALNNKDEVAVRTAIRGAAFELSRINTVMRQGLEQVDFNLQIPDKIRFVGYTKKDGFDAEPTKEYNSTAELDVPIVRDEKPYIYETKSYPRMLFGSLPTQRNQLLKYQAAIDQGIVDGATVEIKGRIHPYILDWAAGRNIAEEGHAPDVEIIYSMDLPSGAEYRFVLNRSRRNNGLNFQNEGRSSTAEVTLKRIKETDPNHYVELQERFGNDDSILEKLVEDRQVINGIQRAVLDRSIVDILSSVDIENPPEELVPYLENPMSIKVVGLFDKYESLRQKSIFKKLLDKRTIINTENTQSAYSEFATHENIEHSVREYQDYLRQNPEMAKIKKAYILDGEEAIKTAISKTEWEIGKIRDFELRRMQAESDPSNWTRRIRAEMGYVGRPEGVALDLEHIVIDAIQETNKREGQTGRSYANPERFKKVEQLGEYLEGQDRRYQEIAVYDPSTDKIKRYTDINDGFIEKTEFDLLKENIRRAEKHITDMETRLAELSQRTELSQDEKLEARFITSRMRSRQMKSRSIADMKARIETLRTEKTKVIRAEKDVAKKRQLASEYDNITKTILEGVANAYQEVVGGKLEWDKFAERVTERVDQNLIKFAYVATSDGEIIADEEVIRGGTTTGRAAHSELAQGRNVYGAGEIVFSKTSDGNWVLTEINNGSGHYRPSASVLPYVKNLIASKGVDTTFAQTKDALMRGTPLMDVTILEE